MWFVVLQVESLRKDIEILSQNHERDVDRKDAIIQMLDRDLEEVGILCTLPYKKPPLERLGLDKRKRFRYPPVLGVQIL